MSRKGQDKKRTLQSEEYAPRKRNRRSEALGTSSARDIPILGTGVSEKTRPAEQQFQKFTDFRLIFHVVQLSTDFR
jgi:hypothetical protein